MPDLYNDVSDAYPQLSLGWQYNTEDPTPFGTMILPAHGIYGERFTGLDNTIYVHPFGGWGLDRDSLYNLMYGVDHKGYNFLMGPNDMSLLHTTNAFTLNPGQTQTIVTLTGDGAPAPMGGFLSDALKFAGFYRGDVDMDCDFDLADGMVIAKTYFGTPGFYNLPFNDQGDVDANGMSELADAIRVVNTYFGKTGFPISDIIDYPRFPIEIPFPNQGSMFEVDVFNELCKKDEATITTICCQCREIEDPWKKQCADVPMYDVEVCQKFCAQFGYTFEPGGEGSRCNPHTSGACEVTEQTMEVTKLCCECLKISDTDPTEFEVVHCRTLGNWAACTLWCYQDQYKARVTARCNCTNEGPLPENKGGHCDKAP